MCIQVMKPPLPKSAKCTSPRSGSSAGRLALWGGLLAAVFFLGFLETSPARAQNSDLGALVDRLGRLERDLQILQREIYRGKATPSSTSPAIEATTASPDSSAPTAAARMEIRMLEIETEIRALTGRIEELQFRLSEFGERLDRVGSDLELRLGALEQRAPAATATPGYSPPPAGEEQPFAPPSAPILGEAPPQAASLPPKEAYNHAFSLLSRRDYGEAERELKAFLAAYPNDALAANATYWLGETYFVRNDFRQAAVTFLEGYQKEPKGSKAPDNLLKLAVSLGNLGEKKEACAALGRLVKEFQNASATVRQRVADERKRSACP